MSARQDVGLRRHRHLGVGRVHRRVRRRPGDGGPSNGQGEPLEHVPNVGFLLYDGEKGEIYFRLFSYARYLNQRNLDPTYVDSFGNTHSVQLRQDVQLQKFFAPFAGWYLTPKFRYYLYVWSSNPSQGDPAQVVGAGNLSYSFNRFVTFGAGITSLPSVAEHRGAVSVLARRGQPAHRRRVLPGLVHLRRLAQGRDRDEAQVHGDVRQQPEHARRQRGAARQQVRHAVVHAAVAADDRRVRPLRNVRRLRLTTRRSRPASGRALHAQPRGQAEPAGHRGIENSQIRLTDGSIIFTPNLFGPGITVNEVDYHMMSVDARHQVSRPARRGRVLLAVAQQLHRYQSRSGIADISDTGYQMQSSAMAVKKTLQMYLGWSQIFGDYGNPWEVRVGANWYSMKERGLRVNGELMYVNKSPVGYTAYPYPGRRERARVPPQPRNELLSAREPFRADMTRKLSSHPFSC